MTNRLARSAAIGPDIVRLKRVEFWPPTMGVPWHKIFLENWQRAAAWCEACQAGEILEQQEEGKTATDFKTALLQDCKRVTAMRH